MCNTRCILLIMERIVFYSWQSDLPNRTNRVFIENCLRCAIESIEESNVVPDGLDIDRDTLNRQGSPDIVKTIFDKIERCDVFVGDISIINTSPLSNQRKTPNPNVLVELGYAARARSWHRVLCICNTAFGPVHDLPFDIRHRRVITYSLAENEYDTNTAQNQLVDNLISRITEILSGNLSILCHGLRQFFNEIDPSIMVKLMQGQRSISMDVPASHAQRLRALQSDPAFANLAKFQPNNSFFWTDSRGPRNGYIVNVTDEFIKNLT